MAGNDNGHYLNLQKLCRVCGNRRTKGKACHVNLVSEKIREKFSINVDEDSAEIHPKYLCSKCTAQLTNTLMDGEKSEVKLWEGHSSSGECKICQVESSFSSTPPLSSSSCIPRGKRKKSHQTVSPTAKSLKEDPVKVKDLNEMLVCIICTGYFVDPVTVTECLHSFCKSCIVQHLQTRHTCPVCKTVIHETTPLLNLRFDGTYKTLIDKMIPGITATEQQRQEEFYRQKDATTESKRGLTKESEESQFPPDDGSSYYHTQDVRISLCLEPEASEKLLKPLPMKFMRCSMRARVQNLIELIQGKTMQRIDLDILCNKQNLDPDLTLESIWVDTWKLKEAPMRLFYRKKAH